MIPWEEASRLQRIRYTVGRAAYVHGFERLGLRISPDRVEAPDR